MNMIEQYMKDREELLLEASQLHPYNDALKTIEIYKDIHWLTLRIERMRIEIMRNERMKEEEMERIDKR